METDTPRAFGTPMMQQYQTIKKDYPDCLLLFRLGDFYELFLDDAIVGSKILNITLTKRPRGKDGDIPMAGVPFHAADSYIAKLVRSGHKVAICEQVSEPSSRGIVERDVVRIVTRGTMLDEKNLEAKESNTIMCISPSPTHIGIAFVDISTGEISTTELAHDGSAAMLHEIVSNHCIRFAPVECIIAAEKNQSEALQTHLQKNHALTVHTFSDWMRVAERAADFLKKHFQVKTLRGFGLHGLLEAQKAAAVILSYVSDTQKSHIQHINSLRTFSNEHSMNLDGSTIVNLELFSPLRREHGDDSLIAHLDHTKTAMGGRLLRQWIREPLISKSEIEARQHVVEIVTHDGALRNTIQKYLSDMYDTERIVSRLSVGLSNPHDVRNLLITLEATLRLSQVISEHSISLFNILTSERQTLEDLISYIRTRIVADPPFDAKNGGVIAVGVNSELDELRKSIESNTQWMADFEQTERARTGIPTLKVKFNSVFGYYIEITHTHLKHVPDNYIRKQTTVNSERYITPELKTYEDTILHAQEKMFKKEYMLFLETVGGILEKTAALQRIARVVASIDCLASFAQSAVNFRYVKPSIVTEGDLVIHDGRHPVVEQLNDISFVPNNTHLGAQSTSLMLLTGPNMAGKSVYMRQVALIVLMAHCGSFVPARRAVVPLTDHIFVRSGAADSIARGLSTFMVEMVETAYILRHATPRSLIIMDEIGRGTSTYDGISIAWAIAEHLVTVAGSPKTLFATHYHELQDLEKKFPERIKNFHMAIEEHRERPIFLYRVTEGGARGSYAIAVAELAGIPPEVSNKARALLQEFSKRQTS